MILFKSPQCQPCSVLTEWLEVNKVTGVKAVDVTQDRDTAVGLGVRSVPTLVVNDNLYIGLETIKNYFIRHVL